MSLHSKAAVFDGRQVFIGPLNLDPRSVLWNSEVGVLIDSPTLASAVRQLVAEGQSGTVSYEVELGDCSQSAGLVWNYEDDQGRALRLKREPANPWRRFNAWLARFLKIEAYL